MATTVAISPDINASRYEALFRAVSAIATCCDCETTAATAVKELHALTNFDYLHLVAFEKETNTTKWCLLHVNGRRINGEAAGPTEDSPILRVHEEGRSHIVDDWTRETQFANYRAFLREFDIASTCTFPLSRGGRRLGIISIGSSRAHAYSAEDVRFFHMVADQIGLAVDAAVNSYLSQRAQDRLKLILDLNNQVVTNLEFSELLRTTSANVRRVMQADAAAIMLPEPDGNHLCVHALDFPDSHGIFTEGGLVPIADTLPGEAFRSGKPIVLNRLDPAEIPPEMYRKAKAEGLNSYCDVPLISRGRVLGILAVARHEEDSFDQEEIIFLTQVANQVAIAVENALAYGEIADLKDKLAQEKLYLEDEIRGEMDFEGIVGQSSALRHVLQLVETVAPSDSTVLLLGETGTGKELIARAIHDRSRRKDRTLVKLNCAAIPTGLLESELFGHERGAFTGAITQKIGRLELADQGTLFLDEVGDEISPSKSSRNCCAPCRSASSSVSAARERRK